MTEIFLQVNNYIKESANSFANYLCNCIMNHLEGKVCGLIGNEKWPDGSHAQIVFQLNISRDEADDLVSELNEEDPDEAYGSWFLADEA